jgi:hypothetical protein
MRLRLFVSFQRCHHLAAGIERCNRQPLEAAQVNGCVMPYFMSYGAEVPYISSQ